MEALQLAIIIFIWRTHCLTLQKKKGIIPREIMCRNIS